jgi:hypothetical protein
VVRAGDRAQTSDERVRRTRAASAPERRHAARRASRAGVSPSLGGRAAGQQRLQTTLRSGPDLTEAELADLVENVV